MAARSFLSPDDTKEALKRLMEKVKFPAQVGEARRALSRWLEERLSTRLNEFGDFLALHPVLLGSWARHELTPKSDIDILFVGDEALVKEFVGKAFQRGLKFRTRVPENRDDWTVGVAPFDILALHFASGLTPEAAQRLECQRGRLRPHRSEIARAVRREREERHKRQDSISNYLEPNLKFGVGGLRDIEQALAMRRLFPEMFANEDAYPFEVLESIKEQFLFFRCLLHLMGSGDILTAHDQLEITTSLNLGSQRELMTQVQSELERASFYSDWAVAFASSSARRRHQARIEPQNLAHALSALADKPDILRQFVIRRHVEDLTKPYTAQEKAKHLAKALNQEVRDEFLVALHRTRLLEMFIPDFKKVRGLVQHDHYHRYTADAHLVQALREVQRAKMKPKSLGRLSRLAKELTSQDWWILKLTALFHDLGKGRKGDHSTEGARLADRYLSEWGYPEPVIKDVRWLVQNHLILSTAAFRQNPQAQATWQRLFEKGVEGKRLLLLALFTAIDIRATNPKAWTGWKSQLLSDLVGHMRSPQALTLQRHLEYAKKKKIVRAEGWLLSIDPVLTEFLSPRILVEDLQSAFVSATDLAPKVLRFDRRVWVRLHRRSDETGVFARFVEQLFGLGLSIQIASVQTLEGIGVYDWLCLRTEKPARQIGKWLSSDRKLTGPSATPKVRLQSIDLVSCEAEEWILSFRGRDQRGLLLAAAQALAEENLSVRWARVHTWGQQVEDVFGIRPFGELEPLLERLRARFVT
jgi:[protein-PII] uridylyltransferase